MLTISSLRASTAQAALSQGDPRPVSILSTNPIIQNKTITIKGEARGTRVYPMTITFYNVDFSNEKDAEHPLFVRSRLGDPFFMSYIEEGSNPVQVRCACPFFRFAWSYWNKQEKALTGPAFPTYIRKTTTRAEVNPQHSPGLCKHLLGMLSRLRSDKILV